MHSPGVAHARERTVGLRMQQHARTNSHGTRAPKRSMYRDFLADTLQAQIVQRLSINNLLAMGFTNPTTRCGQYPNQSQAWQCGTCLHNVMGQECYLRQQGGGFCHISAQPSAASPTFMATFSSVPLRFASLTTAEDPVPARNRHRTSASVRVFRGLRLVAYLRPDPDPDPDLCISTDPQYCSLDELTPTGTGHSRHSTHLACTATSATSDCLNLV